MTISSSLNASVAGLAANASRLAAISDNIANSATHGYKRATTDFHAMVTSSTKSTYTAGGVQSTTQRLIDEVGALKSTSNSTDLAVRGRGFLPVAPKTDVLTSLSSPTMQLATTGSFRTDKEGYLRTETGLVLLGWTANADGTIPTYPRDSTAGLSPVRINTNQFAGEATTAMTLGVNLPATETEPGASGQSFDLSVEYFDNLGASQNITVTYTPSVPAPPATAASNEWRMTLRDSASGDALVGAYDLVFDSSRASGGTLASVSQPYVDSNGNDLPAGSGGTQYGGPYNAGTFDVAVAGGPIDVTIGDIGSGLGMTQFSNSFAPTTITKDGSPVGNLASVEVDPSGFVIANFDVGISRTLYQIPLVDLPNANGLTTLDNQAYGISNESGAFFMWDAGDGPTGDVISYALEESATDVAGELTSLIQTQRAYSSNAKVIQTVDEMLQETTNIKR